MTSQPAPLRRPWLLPVLFALFIAIPIAEVWGLVAVGQQIGALPTIAILLGTAVLGSWLMRREGSRAWKALNEAFSSGRMPTGELADAALVLVGGVLLMLPGFFTDVIGLFFLLPLTRPLARRLIGFVIARQAARAGVDLGAMRARMERDRIVPGETVPDADPPGPSDSPQVIRGEIEP